MKKREEDIISKINKEHKRKKERKNGWTESLTTEVKNEWTDNSIRWQIQQKN